MLLFSSVMFWTHDHEAILCREVVNVNPYTTKKGYMMIGIGIGYPNCIHIIKINTQLIPNYIRKISFVIHYVCILPLNSQTLLGFGP